MPLYTFTICYDNDPSAYLFTTEKKAKRFAIFWAMEELDNRGAYEEATQIENATNDEGIDAAYEILTEDVNVQTALDGWGWALKMHEGIGA